MNGALSALNQAVPFICKELLKIYGAEHVHFCTGRDTSLIRSSLGYEKTKDNQMYHISVLQFSQYVPIKMINSVLSITDETGKIYRHEDRFYKVKKGR